MPNELSHTFDGKWGREIRAAECKPASNEVNSSISDSARRAAKEILEWLNFDTSLDAVQADVYGVWAIISKYFAAVKTGPCCFYCDGAIAQHRETGEWIHAVSGLTTCRTLRGSKHDGINHATPHFAAGPADNDAESLEVRFCWVCRSNHRLIASECRAMDKIA